MLLRSRLITARYVARRLQTQNPPADFLRAGLNFCQQAYTRRVRTGPVYRARAGASDCWSYFARDLEIQNSCDLAFQPQFARPVNP